MPEPSRTPLFIQRCVRAVASKYGGDVSRAFAICVGQMQKAGYLKPGTMEPTAAGKKLSRLKAKEKGAKKKVGEYEKLLKAAKKKRKEAAAESLTHLVVRGWMLLEQGEEEEPAEEEPAEEEPDEEGEPDEEDDLASQLSKFITGTLTVRAEFEIGDAPEKTREGVVRLLRRYKGDFKGGGRGTNRWDVEAMDVLLEDDMVTIELKLHVYNYKGEKVLGELAIQVANAVEELADSAALSGVKKMLGDITSDAVSVEPTDFVEL